MNLSIFSLFPVFVLFCFCFEKRFFIFMPLFGLECREGWEHITSNGSKSFISSIARNKYFIISSVEENVFPSLPAFRMASF